MAGWNLALRFGLELAAVAGLATIAWRSTADPLRWIVVLAVPAAAVVAWTVFNVPGDPSRSGAAPVPVPGWVRLALELFVLGAGATAFLVSGPRWVGAALAGLIVVHYASSIARVRWLLDQRGSAPSRTR